MKRNAKSFRKHKKRRTTNFVWGIAESKSARNKK